MSEYETAEDRAEMNKSQRIVPKKFELSSSPGEPLVSLDEMVKTDSKPPFDPINKPKHYNSHPSGIETIEVTEWHNFNIGNAIKYLWRAGLKDGEEDIKDLRKAIWYITREIDRLSR